VLPGLDEIVAELIYTILYYTGLLLWGISRILLSVAVFIQNVEAGLTENIGVFVEAIVNALSGPMGLIFILALATLGTWYTLNNIVATRQWVDPSKLITYGLVTMLFFAAPLTLIDGLEAIRQAINSGIEATILDDAIADMFSLDIDDSSGYADQPLPAAIPDVNSDGNVATFDLVAYFLSIENIVEVFRSSYPAGFADQFFPDHPSEINLADEGARDAAIEAGWSGILQLGFSFILVPTTIAEHLLWLALTLVAVLLYVGVPFAMAVSYFALTEAFLAGYIRQFIKLLIETFFSVVFASFAIGLVAAASQVGTGIYIGANIAAFIILVWRIKGALKLATGAFDMFGGGTVTGGASGRDLRTAGQSALRSGVVAGAAALTGGAALGMAGLLKADQKAAEHFGMETGFSGQDLQKTDYRVRQLVAGAAYAGGKVGPVRHAIENAHELRSFGRNLRDGEFEAHEPDILDFARLGAAQSNFGSSPWLAMRLSPELRLAADALGGRSGAPYRAEDGAPVNPGATRPPNSPLPSDDEAAHRLTSPPDAAGNEPFTGHRPPAGSGAAHRPPPPPAFEEEMPYAPSPGNRATPTPPLSPAETTRTTGRATGAQGGYTASAARDVDQDGIPDWERAAPASNAVTPAPTDTIQINIPTETQQTTLMRAIAGLEEPNSPAGQAVQQLLTHIAGPNNAHTITTAVAEHSVSSVQAAASATMQVISQAQAEGKTPQAILSAFQSGDALTAVRDTAAAAGSPLSLSNDHLYALADAAMLPQRQLDLGGLLTAMNETIQAGGGDDRALADHLHAPTHFGPLTGTVRQVMSGMQQMQLSPADVAHIAAQIQAGQGTQTRQDLLGRGHAPAQVDSFINNVSSLPPTISVVQSTQPFGDTLQKGSSGGES
jgi:hypothetical protein